MHTEATSLGVSEELYVRQLELEKQSAEAGTRAWTSMLQKAKDRKSVGDTALGGSLMKRLIDPSAQALARWIIESRSGTAGKHSTASKVLSRIQPPVAVYLAVKTCLNNLLARREMIPMLQLVEMAGKEVEDEMRFQAFEEQKPKLWAKILQSTSGDTSEHRRRVMKHAANKFEIEWKSWPKNDRIHVGSALLEIIRSSTGLIQWSLVRVSRKRPTWMVSLTSEAQEIVGVREEALSTFFPTYYPTLIPPKDWTSLKGGGYYSSHFRPLSLVKASVRVQANRLKGQEWSQVYAAINSLQRTAWKVNSPVLEVLMVSLENQDAIGDLPDGPPIEPPKPGDIDTNKEARKAWAREASNVKREKIKWDSKWGAAGEAARLAHRFSSEEAIYFPYQLDFRGRIYAAPPILNPQGPDYVKALLTFAEGKPLGDDTAVAWLAIHGANCFGVDKAPFNDRIEWVDKHREQIVECAAGPYENRWWTEADEPWQFLAFCYEWAGFETDGYDFVSHLPVAIDGSCNGIQHFSAMLRDPVGGEAVNLLPADKPQDIYQRVADVLMDRLEEISTDVDTEDEEKKMASKWLAFGVDRSMAKRPVMILPYGGTRHAFAKYIEEELEKTTTTKDRPNPFGDKTRKACFWLASRMWDATGEVVVAARTVMDGMKTLAREAAKKQQPIHWTTPDGFPVCQACLNFDIRRVKTRIGNSLIYFNMMEKTDELHRNRQASSIAPNFVHSMDAAHLRMTVLGAAEQGVSSFGAVHDSYATVAADVETMATTLRSTFVHMYEDHDVLGDLWGSVRSSLPFDTKLPPPLVPGDLNLQDVLRSDYFFA